MNFLPLLAGFSKGQSEGQDLIQQREQRAQQMQFEQMRMQAMQAEMARQAQDQQRQQDIAKAMLATYQSGGGQPPQQAQPPMPGQPSQPMQQPAGPQGGLGLKPPPSMQPQIPPYQSMSGAANQGQPSNMIPEPPKYDWDTAIQKIKAQGVTDPQAILAALDKHQSRLDVEARAKLAQIKEMQFEADRKEHLTETSRHNKEMERIGNTRADKARDYGRQPAGGGGLGTGSGGALSKEAIDFAARQVLLTGQMPPMGMGKAAAAQRAAVLNRAAELSKAEGTDAGDLQGNKADIKANSAALSQLTKLDGMIGNFEQTAVKNANLAMSLAKKGGAGTNFPTINAWMNAARVGTGSGDVIAFRNALTTFKTEYAKILSGATGAAGITDAARREADSLMNENMSPEQLQMSIDTAKKEMGNRRSSLKEQIDATRKSIKSVGKRDAGDHPADIGDLLKKYGG